MTEAQHQAAVFKWAAQPAVRARWPELKLLHHIPNGGSRDAVEGRHLKAQGVKAGVPDMHLPVARGGYHSLYIELKAGSGRVSPQQDWWIDELSVQGNFTAVCYGWKSAAEVLERYLSLGQKEGGSSEKAGDLCEN